MKGYNYERRTKEVVLSVSLGQLNQVPKLTLVALSGQMPPADQLHYRRSCAHALNELFLLMG
jgi:hypothetical protein